MIACIYCNYEAQLKGGDMITVASGEGRVRSKAINYRMILAVTILAIILLIFGISQTRC